MLEWMGISLILTNNLMILRWKSIFFLKLNVVTANRIHGLQAINGSKPLIA